MTDAMNKIKQIDRKNCRKSVEQKFSVEKMIDGYEKVIKKMI